MKKLIAATALAITLAWLIVFYMGYTLATASSIRNDAYTITGRWASQDDYDRGLLTVDNLPGSPFAVCSDGASIAQATANADGSMTYKFLVAPGTTTFRYLP